MVRMNIKDMTEEQKVYAVRQILLASVADHESTCTDGPGTCHYRVNVIAFLCHALGLDTRTIQGPLTALTTEYDMLCKGRHMHGLCVEPEPPTDTDSVARSEGNDG